MRYLAAAIQFEPVMGDKPGNVDRLLAMTAQAADRGARLIVMPEMATTGYCWSNRDEIASLVEPIPGPTVSRFAKLAASTQTWIVAALPEYEPSNDCYYNTAVLIGPDGIVGRYRKTHPYITEVRWAKDGDLGLPVFDTPLGRLGMLICMDAEYPETARVLALADCDVVCFPTNWLSEHSPSAYWIQRAWENGAYWIAANRFGFERGVQFSGGSAVISPEGALLDVVDDAGGIAIAEVDLEVARRTRVERLCGRHPDQYAAVALSSYLWPGVHSTTNDATALEGIVALSSPPSVAMLVVSADDTAILESVIDSTDHADIVVLRPLSHVVDERSVRQAAELAAKRLDELELVARTRGIAIVVSAVIVEGGTAFDALVLLGSGEGRVIHRNTHPASTKGWATPGDVPPVVLHTPHGMLGIVAADELLAPEPLRGVAARGAELCAVSGSLDSPAAIGVRQTKVSLGPPEQLRADPMYWLLPRVRAAENNIWLAFANSGSIPSGIFGPSFYEWPRNEKLVQDGSACLVLPADPTDSDRRIALEKPYLRMRYPHLYGTLTALGPERPPND